MTTAAAPRNYEFSAPENVVIRQLVDAMRFVSAASLSLGAFCLLLGLACLFTQGKAGLGAAINSFVYCPFFALIGGWLQRAVDAFTRVVETTGSDIPHLLTALSELTRVFSLGRALFVVALLGTVTSIGVQGVLSLG